MTKGIYVASKTCHADKWLALRAAGAPIISTWIDDHNLDWVRLCDVVETRINEVKRSSVLVFYLQKRENPRFAFAEAGAALASGIPVFWVGPRHSWISYHPLTEVYDSLDEAIAWARVMA